MFKFLLVVCVVAALSWDATADDFDERVIGGGEVDIADFPHQLSLRRTGIHVCGATAIGQYWAITAAHCILRTPAFQFTLRGGSSNRHLGLLFQVDNTVLHPDFNGVTLENNVGLLHTSDALIGTNVAPIPLDVQATLIPDTTPANSTGWGVTQVDGGDYSDLLRGITVNIVSADRCDEILSEYGGVTPSTICASADTANVGICYGDDGGPIVANGVLVGVVSWSVSCGPPNVPTVFSRIAAMPVRSFIRSNTGL